MKPSRTGSPRAPGGTFLALLGIALLALGCGALRREPDLARLYEARAVARRTPVIVIPGILGSRLEDPDSGREIWPGGAWNLISGRHFHELELSTDARAGRTGDRLVPGDVFHEAFGADYYGEILATLSGPGGYHCVPAADLEERRADADCVLLAWDWRRDLVEAAQQLTQVVGRIREIRDDPQLRVDIVAHSAGGLVARYFARFGAVDVLGREDPEAAIDPRAALAVRRMILVGTPNYGSVSALQGAIMGNDLGFASMRPELLATMPSLFELFPNPNRTWMIDARGARLDVDLFDTATWREYRWSIFDPVVRERVRASAQSPEAGDEDLRSREQFFGRALTRARRFHRALSAPLRESATEYVVFGGDCDLTPARCLLETVEGRVVVRLRPEEVRGRLPGVDYERLMLEPGDGRVTKASLLGRDNLSADAQPGFFPISNTVFICRGHSALPSDITFRDNLLNILLY